MNRHADIKRRAAKLRALYQKDPREFHTQFDSLAYPGGLERGLKLLRSGARGRARGTELAIEFLEVDPMFQGSGRIKEDLLQRLKSCELGEQQKYRLNQVILRVVETRGGREFKKYCQLARKTRTFGFEEELKTLLNSDDAEIRKRAERVVEAMNS